MSTKLKSWLVLALIFVAGALSGGALTLVLAPHFLHPHPHPRDPKIIERDIMAGLTRELSLTADQQAKIQPIIGDAAKEMHEVHKDEVQRISQIIKLTTDQVTPLLTADQKTQLDKLEAEDGASIFFGRPRQHAGPPSGPPDRSPESPGPPDQSPPPPPGEPPPPAPPATNAPPQ